MPDIIVRVSPSGIFQVITVPAGVPTGDGTVALPQGYNFASELGLGWFRIGAGIMGLAQGGNELARFFVGGGNTVLRLTGGTTRLEALDIQSAIRLNLLSGAGTLCVSLDNNALADNQTAIRSLLLREGAGFPNKQVSQGHSDSGDVGARALTVPNTGTSTAVAAGDFALANWGGVGEGVVVAAGSTCRRGKITVTAGAAPLAGWTITLTFPVPFPATPFAIAARNDQNNPPVINSMGVTGLASTTQLVMSELGVSAPIAATTYDFTWIVMA